MKTDKLTQEQSGRWTALEHELFLQGLERYGKNWKAIERVVGTRTSTQARSHAQKYFLKADKGRPPATATRLKTSSPEPRTHREDVGVQYGEGVVFSRVAEGPCELKYQGA
jgi:SHAQKYF class myb-like DNA-binding protein